MRVPRLALDAARAGAGTARRRHGARPPGRAVQRVLRARPREGAAPPPSRSRAPAAPPLRSCSRPSSKRRRHACPLYLLTADRPPRLRGTGANQTIDQVRLFGVYPRKYLAPPTPATAEDARDWRRTGREAVAACGGPQPGPVHINCSFDEPLVPTGDVVDVPARDPARVELPDRHPEPLAADVERMAHELSGARGVVVAGSSWWMPPDQMSLLAERLGWPLLAEPTSGLRRPGRALATGQALIRSAGFAERHRPEVVLQIGATPTTRATQTFVAAAERLLVVDRFHPEPDPEREASWRLDADPRHVAAAVMAHEIEPAPLGWSAGWSDHDERARRAMDDVLDTTDEPTELRLARDLAAAVPDGGTLFVGNSTPIRDVDIAMAPRDGLQVLANRGASGIDGLVSTALGIGDRRPGCDVRADRRPLAAARRRRTALERPPVRRSRPRRAEQRGRRHLRVARPANAPGARPPVRDAARPRPRADRRCGRRRASPCGADVPARCGVPRRAGRRRDPTDRGLGPGRAQS